MTLLTLAHGRYRENPTSKCGPPFKVRRHTDPAQTHVLTLSEGAAAADAVWGVWPNNSNATATCSPHLPLFPSPLSPPNCIPYTCSEGAAAAEFGVGRVAEQQQRHHDVLPPPPPPPPFPSFPPHSPLPIAFPVPAVKVLLQLNAAWGVWPNNSNATTACSAWDGLTCRPKGLVVAL
ncbi:unnamed protein product [Closterium sp. NIES-65]|nr:unnamed protein product [Closterium sp. NIES-65]